MGCQIRDWPQLKAARVSEEDGGVDAPDTSLSGVDNAKDWEDGSQWESMTEGEGSLCSQEETPQLNKISQRDILLELDEEDRVYIRAIRDRVISAWKENPSQAAMHPKIDQPQWTRAYESCLAAYVKINGMEALTLFDSGSSTDVVSLDFAQVSDTRVYTLDKLILLQLGTVGSHASINYRMNTSVEFRGHKEDRYYLNMVNINRYDVILGAPFMWRFRVRLDFTSNSICVGPTVIQALLPEEEAAVLKGCRARREDSQGN